LLIPFIFLSMALFCNVANANTFSDGVSSFFSFLNKNIIGQIKKDFCKQYVIAFSSGEWKAGEFRTNLGKNVCTDYSANSEKIDDLNGDTAMSQTDIPGTFSVNNPTPDVYAPYFIGGGTNLNINKIISLTNSERKDNDPELINLKEDNALTNVAVIRVKDMFAHQYFEHNSPAGDNASKEAVKNGYSYITIGENIALGNFDGSAGLVTAWMNSPGHRANILNKNYTEIGVYAEQGNYNGQKVWIAAQIFGKPMAGCAEPEKSLKDNISQYKISADNILSNIKKIESEIKLLNAADAQTYTSKVAERNTLAGLYNNLASEIKTLVTEYNKKVATYNSCIKTI